MTEKFELSDLEQIEESDSDMELNLDNEDFTSGVYECVDGGCRDDGLMPMKDEISRGYFEFSQDRIDDFFARRKLKKIPNAQDTERILSGNLQENRTGKLFLPLRSVKLKFDTDKYPDSGADTSAPFSRNADEVKTRKLIKPSRDSQTEVEIVDDFARQLLKALE